MSKWIQCFLVSSLTCAVLGAVGCSEDNPFKDPLREVKDRNEKLDDIETIAFNPKLDILFVVDDSGSMSGHQSNVAAIADGFIRGIQGNGLIDYHIGVVSTDMKSVRRSGRLAAQVGSPLFIDRFTPNGFQALARNIVVGDRGDWEEMHFAPILAAITPPISTSHNAGFYRDDAYLGIIIIADSEDQSPAAIQASIVNELIKMKGGDKEKVVAYGGIIPVAVNNCSRGGETPPVKTEQFILDLGGTAFSLCDPDAGEKLARIGDDLRNRVELFVPLPDPPVLETLEVTYGQQVIPQNPINGWMYDAERIGLVFGPELVVDQSDPNAEFNVTYTPARLER
jgi:hypothetical protein